MAPADFERQRIERLRATTEMQPPWEMFPDIPRYSIGWRMGAGEDCWHDWRTWFRGLSVEGREHYRRIHPEPKTWEGVYDSLFKDSGQRPHGLAWDEYWNAELKAQLERLAYFESLTPPKPLAIGHGRCLADETVGDPGARINFMYREQRSGRKVAFSESERPDDCVDSGWRFLSGPDQRVIPIVIRDVNTIANWDPDIIPLLDSPIPSAFARDNHTGGFIEVQGFQPPV